MENAGHKVAQPFMVKYAFDSLVHKLSNFDRPDIPESMPRDAYPLFVTWNVTKNGQ